MSTAEETRRFNSASSLPELKSLLAFQVIRTREFLSCLFGLLAFEFLTSLASLAELTASPAESAALLAGLVASLAESTFLLAESASSLAESTALLVPIVASCRGMT
jgi:hypothetical protein